MLKKLVAGAVAAILALAAVALIASPASAHHNTVWPTVTCNTDGTYKISWSVQNSEGAKTEVITASSNEALVPIGTSFGFAETKYFIQTVTTPTDLTLTLTGFWADGNVESTNGATLTKSQYPKGCLNATPSASQAPSICDGPNHFTSPTYTIVSTPGIKYLVDGVETPAGTYPATNGTTVHVEAQINDDKYKLVGQSIWDFTFAPPADTCIQKVDAPDPSFMQQACAGVDQPGVVKLASFTIPAATGVIYSVKFDGAGETVYAAGTYTIPSNVTTVTVIAKGDADKYYELNGGTKIYPDFTVLPAGKCLVLRTPIAPDPAQSTCDVVNAPGVVPTPTYTLHPVDHVIYSVSTNGVDFTDVIATGLPVNTVPGATITVKARVDDTTKYQIDGKALFTLVFTNPGDCKPELTPVAPEFAAQYCDETDLDNPFLVNGVITIPVTTGIQYFIDGAPVSAGPHDVSNGDHTVGAAVTDSTKYKLDNTVLLPFPVHINSGECLPTFPLVIPAVSSSQIGCFSTGSYTLSNDHGFADAVIWKVNGSVVAQGKYTVSSATTLTITATANGPKYGFAPGTQTSWTVSFAKPAVCDTTTLAMTGQTPTGGLIAADLLLVSGLALFGLRALRRRPEMA